MYDRSGDQFLVNIREPACVVMLKAQSSTSQIAKLPVSVPGPHGLDIDEEASLAFVACDGGAIAELDLKDSPRETRLVSIAGEPDVIWYNSLRHHLYRAIARPGVVDVIDTKTMTLIQEVHTEEGAHTLTFDNTHQRLYILLPESCRAAIYQEQVPH
jgi:DNA-binding beta-propeller fold protein YncE